MEEKNIDLNDYLVSLRKRKKVLIAIVVALMCVFAIVTYLLPTTYKSSATILIEQQEIPRYLVMSTVTSYAAERIQTIQAQVMSRSNLFKIIDKFNLYENERKRETSEAIIARMREDTSLEVVSAKVVDPATGRPSSATIAFSLSYEGPNPAQVQKVVSELTTLYLNKNLENRTSQAQETSEFFREESERIKTEMTELEEKLAIFKQNNAKLLPDMQSVNMQAMQRIESSIASTNSAIINLEDRKFYLEGKLQQIQPDNPLVQSVSSRLKQLETAYASASSRYSESHPDVISLKTEIEALRSGISNNVSDTLARQIKTLRTDADALAKKYTQQHPDVVAINAKIASLEEQFNDAQNKKVDEVEEYLKESPDNPAYITLKAQLDSVLSEILALKQQKKEQLKKQDDLEKVLLMSPEVEREYRVLSRDYSNATSRYREIKEKQRSADISMQLESESKGERFTLIDPAALPEEPVSPNRPIILLIGFILSVGSSVGYALVADAVSGTVRGSRGIEAALGMAPLSVVPYQLTMLDIDKRQKINKGLLFFIIGAIIFVLLIVHFLMTPLDVLWFRMLRKIDILFG